MPQKRTQKKSAPARGGSAEAPQHTAGEPQRIAKLLARAGVASRREIERMIADGRIALNGEKLTTPATILTDLAGVTVDGKPVRPPAAARLWRFYKPAGCLTAANDPKGRPTIYDRLPAGLPRVMPVGRLDFMTEGLLLLTNDGELKRQLELPKTGVVRRYRARAFGDITQEQLEELAEGVEIEGVRYGSIDANLERRTGRNTWIELALTEGKNREVRRVLAYLGLQVSRLIRTSYGPLGADELEPGQVAEVQREDLFRFRQTLK
nr:pseudouridine synthase [Sphingomonas sp. BN140010]